MATEQTSTPVVGKREDTQWLRRLDKAGEIVLILGAVWTVLYILYLVMTGGGNGSDGRSPGAFVVGIGMIALGAVTMGTAKGIAAYQERQAWIERMRQQDEEKMKAKSRRE